MLQVDSRETRSAVLSAIRASGISFSLLELPVGDYHLPGHWVVERKAANDFVSSIMDGRLFGQAELLASHEDRPFLCVEGDLSRVASSIDPESLAGALSTLGVIYGINLIHAPDDAFTGRLIARMSRHATEGLGYEIPLRGGKPKPDGSRAQFLVEGLPGVGPETARRLIAHFGSARHVFSATAEGLTKVQGVGPKTAAGIVAALDFHPTSYRTTKTAGPRRSG